MNWKLIWWKIRYEGIELKTVKYFVQGHFWEKFPKLHKFLFPYRHWEVQVRLKSIPEECKKDCQYCGCPAPALQYSSKPCEGGCYPAINKKDFRKRLKGEIVNGYYIVDEEYHKAEGEGQSE